MTFQDEMHVLDQYMFRILQANKEESIRAEERSDKAIQLFMTLLTALFGAIVVIFINLEDAFLRDVLVSVGLLITSGFGFLTFIWIVVSNIARQELTLERFHLYLYFRDKAPITYEKYGQDIYTLNIHRSFMFPLTPFDNVSLAVSLSLTALIMFNTLTISSAIYMALLAFEAPNIYVPLIVGLLTLITLFSIWQVGQKRIRADRLASHQLIVSGKL